MRKPFLAIGLVASAIAWENYRARYDHAFGIEAEGFSAGAMCPLPADRGAKPHNATA
jgi:hypothetical protein